MNAIAKRVLEIALAWLMNPENLKKMVLWTIEFVDRKAKENPEVNYWDTLDEVIDMLIEAFEGKKS